MRNGPMSDWDAFAKTAHGRWVVEPRAVLPTGVGIDTRALAPGQVFFAFEGERVDGHDFVVKATEAGASVVVASRPVDAGGAGVLVVDDVRAALWSLAAGHRGALREQGTAVIGVTGSNGKTTTVRLIEAALASAGPGRRSKKSFNNDLGVPLTVLSARAGDRWLCCEIGTSAPGEIASLTALASPEISVITSIGRAHLERLGSVEGVAREKASILTAGDPPALVRVVPSGSRELAPLLEGLDGVVRFGTESDAKIRIVSVEPTHSDERAGQRITLETPIGTRTFEIPLVGEHNARNAAASWSVGLAMALDADRVEAGLGGAAHASMRLERTVVDVEGGQIEVINDAYNANPESVLAALAVLTTEPGRRVAVLGDMLELGEESDRAHAEVESMARALADEVILVGTRWASPGYDKADDAGLAQRLRPGDTVLLKGSRGVGVERVLGSLDRNRETV